MRPSAIISCRMLLIIWRKLLVVRMSELKSFSKKDQLKAKVNDSVDVDAEVVLC